MHSYLNYYKITKIFAFVLYLAVNTLFVLKYGVRQSYISSYFLLLIYAAIIAVISLLLYKYRDKVNAMSTFNFYYTLIIFFVFVLFVGINYAVDGNSLNTDRWSALQVTVESIINGNYPYTIKDHLGKTTSNLPGLFYLGLPFYLLGNIGLLQAFVFLFGAFFVLKQKINNIEKLSILIFFLLSPAYYWEIFAKSDLMSNLLLLIIFIYFWNNKYHNNYFKRSILLAFFCAFFALTRGVVVIPLTLFLFKDFFKANLNTKLRFTFSGIFFLFLISLPVLVNLPGTDVIVKHNPFNHQTRYAPKLLQVLVLLFPFFLSFKLKSVQDVIFFSFLLFTAFLSLTFIINIFEEGFHRNLYGNLFDISYLGMILPFAILVIAINQEKNTMHA